MLEVSDPWQVGVASWALTYLLHSTVLISLAWGVTRLAWLQARRTREIIWTVALLGGLTTSLGTTLERLRRGRAKALNTLLNAATHQTGYYYYDRYRYYSSSEEDDVEPGSPAKRPSLGAMALSVRWKRRGRRAG